MTCIAGVEHGGKVYIGGDSAGVAGWSITTRADEKVFARKDKGTTWAFGFTSSFRMGQLIRYELVLPKVTPHAKRDLPRFMVRQFIPALRKCLRDGGFAEVRNEVEKGGAFLVGLHGSLFCVDEDFQVGRSRDGYEALGCGQDEARGALAVLGEVDGLKWTPMERIHGALHVTAHLNGGVVPPFIVTKA